MLHLLPQDLPKLHHSIYRWLTEINRLKVPKNRCSSSRFSLRKQDIQTKDRPRRQGRSIWCWTNWASSGHQDGNRKGRFPAQNTPHLYIHRQHLCYQNGLRPKAILRTTTGLHLLPTYATMATKEPSQHPQSRIVSRPFGYPREWTGKPTSQRGNSAPLIIRTNNHTQHPPCMRMSEKGLDYPMEKLLSTTRQLGNSKPDTTIPTPYISLPSTSRQERAIWMTSTMQNRTQLLRGILPKICPFTRPSLPMR